MHWNIKEMYHFVPRPKQKSFSWKKRMTSLAVFSLFIWFVKLFISSFKFVVVKK